MPQAPLGGFCSAPEWSGAARGHTSLKPLLLHKRRTWGCADPARGPRTQEGVRPPVSCCLSHEPAFHHRIQQLARNQGRLLLNLRRLAFGPVPGPARPTLWEDSFTCKGNITALSADLRLRASEDLGVHSGLSSLFPCALKLKLGTSPNLQVTFKSSG